MKRENKQAVKNSSRDVVLYGRGGLKVSHSIQGLEVDSVFIDEYQHVPIGTGMRGKYHAAKMKHELGRYTNEAAREIATMIDRDILNALAGKV